MRNDEGNEKLAAPGWRAHLLGPMTPGAARAVVFLFIFSLLLAAANLLWTARQVGAANAKTQASCQFAADLGGAPVVASPGGKASRLGVTIVADSRQQWHELGCPGHLAPPSPSFIHWARIYHLPAGLGLPLGAVARVAAVDAVQDGRFRRCPSATPRTGHGRRGSNPQRHRRSAS